MVFQKGNKFGFLKGHKFNNRKGVKLTEEHKKKISVALKGSNNGLWKGDDVGYNHLHVWVRKHLQKPSTCQLCNRKDPFDLANVTGVYNREFINWKYLCRSCHMKLDYVVGFRQKYINPNLTFIGRKHSEETKEKIRQKMIGRKFNGD